MQELDSQRGEGAYFRGNTVIILICVTSAISSPLWSRLVLVFVYDGMFTW